MDHIRNLLEGAGCVLEGDYFFALKTREVVSKKYINIDPLFTDAGKIRTIADALFRPFEHSFNCLIGPAVGGIPLVYTAGMLAIDGLSQAYTCHHVTTVFAEKNVDDFKFDRMGFAAAVAGKKVLVLEDISSTGNTTKKVCRLVEKAGGIVIGVSLVWNRGGITASQLGVPKLHSLVEERVETWRVADNPPGWGALPLVADIGHPEYYPDYPGPRINLL